MTASTSHQLEESNWWLMLVRICFTHKSEHYLPPKSNEAACFCYDELYVIWPHEGEREWVSSRLGWTVQPTWCTERLSSNQVPVMRVQPPFDHLLSHSASKCIILPPLNHLPSNLIFTLHLLICSNRLMDIKPTCAISIPPLDLITCSV